MPGAHLAVDDALDLEWDGVSIAPVEAALLEAGGLTSITGVGSSTRIGSIARGMGLLCENEDGCIANTDGCEYEDEEGVPASRVSPGDCLADSSGAVLRPNPLNSGCVLSLDCPRPPGGGGKLVVAASAAGLFETAGDVRCAAGNILGDGSSGERGEKPVGRLLRGGEYGGGTWRILVDMHGTVH
jgi:hypothetical protein